MIIIWVCFVGMVFLGVDFFVLFLMLYNSCVRMWRWICLLLLGSCRLDDWKWLLYW